MRFEIPAGTTGVTMKTLGQLERELQQLRRQLARQQGAPAEREKAAVDAIVGGAPQTTFSSACEQSASRAYQGQVAEAAKYLARNPGLLADAYCAGRLSDEFCIDPRDAHAIVQKAKG